MSLYRLLCLGMPELWRNGSLVSCRTRKTLALFVYLAVTGEMLARETLAAFFWPESDETRGRGMLRNTVSYLRQTLDDPDGRILLTDHHTIGLAGNANIELDLSFIQTAAEQLIRPVTDSAQTISALETAVAHYRGDFLAGYSLPHTPTFDEWVRQQQTIWQQRLGQILDALSRLQMESGAAAQALESCRRWLIHDPLAETAYQRLMQLHLMKGDRAAALQTYTTCRQILAAELGSEPAPETEALAEKVRSEQKAASRPLAPSSSRLLFPFVGRSGEHARLATAYRVVRQGQPQVVVITGEAGIGKTRLAAEFLNWARAQGADILPGRAFESSGQLPYRPLLQPLRSRLEQENAPEDLLDDVWLTELSRLLPELKNRYPDLPAPQPPGSTSRTRLFEAVTRFILALAQRRPIVLFVDDFQWTDAATRDLLHYLLSRLEEEMAPVLILFTLRLETAAELQGWFVDLGRQLPLTRLTLAALSQEDTDQLVTALVGTAQTRPALGQWLFAKTGGQPFYLVETLKFLSEQQALIQRSDGWGWVIQQADLAKLRHGVIPSTVREMVQNRLARLPETAVTMLMAAAVLNEHATFSHLCLLTGQEKGAALSILETLLAAHLLKETETRLPVPLSELALVFTHNTIRHVVYEMIGQVRRRYYHRQVFDILAEENEAHAELAYHAFQCGLVDQAYEYRIDAGDEAMRLFAVKDAITQYEQALDILPDLPTPAANPQRLLAQLGRAYELNENWQEAQVIYRQMLALARRQEDALLECRALNCLATVYANGLNDLAQARTLIQAALAVASASHDEPSIVETKWNLSLVARWEMRTRQALQYGEEALEPARRSGRLELIARISNSLIYPNVHLRRWRTAVACGEEALAYYRQTGDMIMEADCLRPIGWLWFFLGEPDTAVSLLRQAYAISVKMDNFWGKVDCGHKLAQVLLEMGEYEEAQQWAEEGLAGAREMNHSHLIQASLMALGTIKRAMLFLEEARGILLQALALQTETPIAIFPDWALAELCAVETLSGNWATAAQYARSILDIPESKRPISLSGWFMIEAFLRQGEAELARAEITHMGQLAKNNRRYRLLYLRSQAVAARWEGETAQAVASLEEASALAAGMGLLGEQWPILAELAQLHPHAAQAEAAKGQAAEIVGRLAEKIGDEELGKRFVTAVCA
ncbi:MAG: AAA family ATPase [Anaerolineae bacterium]